MTAKFPPSARPVTEGSRLAIVAPSGPFDEEAFRLGVGWLRERYEVVYSDNIYSRFGYLAGSDEHRLHDLAEAINDPSIDAILCARGGFGATRLIPHLDVPAIHEANKMIVGFSDVTALHSLWASAGVRSIHAPMVAALSRASEAIRKDWVSTLEYPERSRQWSLSAFNCASPKAVQGTLIGGNLAVLGALNGTPYTPPLDGAILFIEDVGERPYRVDRMLTTLSQSGWFERIGGLVIGAFTEGDPGKDGVSVDDVFRRHFDGAPFPVLTGFSAGHIDENIPLPFGSPARIEGEKLLFNPS
ncbi:MAG: LD-carboxypeptidase [Verrucomicrobiales bacterium]|nr:LD-carboxypeptidase [Verrucomicrobiales bacterium]